MKNTLTMDRIKERQKRSWEGMFYSVQRLDLLVITISGGGIYVCLETLKYLVDNKMCVSTMVKISGGFFLIAIMTNFISQIFNHSANYNDYLMCETQLDNEEKPKKNNADDIAIYKNNSKRFTKKTAIFNYISTGLMLIGLLLLMYYFLFIF